MCRGSSAPDEEVIRGIALLARLREFFAALTAYAEAYEVFVSGKKLAPSGIGFAHATDPAGALWTGLRAALAILFVSGFWILANWPDGSTATTLVAGATARLATVGPAVPIAVARTLIFSISTIPACVIIEMLLPLASGFEMFALVVAPMLFLCALLLAHKRTHLIGFFSAQLFASAGLFQNRDVIEVDDVGLEPPEALLAGFAHIFWPAVREARVAE
jgi:uncharacterized membrane protein YccC